MASRSPARPDPERQETRRQLWFRVFRLAVLSGALLWTATVASLYYGQHILMYHPLSEHRETPAASGLEYEEVEIETRDGETLSAWYVPVVGRPARGVLLYCHGSGANIGYRVRIIELLQQLDVDVLMFDYRGFGHSTGSPDEPGTYADVDAVWQYLTHTRGIDPAQIVVYGRSMGGPVAAWLATHERPAGLVVDSSFTSLPDFIVDTYPWYLIVPELIEYRYETASYLPDVTSPVLVAHSPEDRMVPFAHGETLFALAPEPKTFLRLEGSHSEGPFESGEGYLVGLGAFLDSILPTDG